MGKGDFMHHTLERLFAFHCAPTFVGIKPANLVSLRTIEKFSVDKELMKYNKRMNNKGIYFRALSYSDKSTLVLVYRKEQIEYQLQKIDICQFLKHYGYDEMDLESALIRLSNRIVNSDGFPHEIGIFLGYPLEDVRGFIEYSGQNYLLSGYWKVYGNLEHTNELFNQYNHCRSEFSFKVGNGCSIEHLCVG